MILTDPIIALTAAVCLFGFCLAVWYYRDTLHPFAFLLPMAAFLFVYLPLDVTCKALLSATFPPEAIRWVKWMNLLFVGSLVVGCFVGSGRRRSGAPQSQTLPVIVTGHLDHRKRLTQVGVILGVCSLAAYLLNTNLQGGFVEAYSTAKGGVAAAATGYLRDPFFWAVPAVVILQLGAYNSPWRSWNYVAIALFITPFFMQAMLASRRGPAFMGFATVGAGWYLARGRRPSLPVLVAGGAGIGLLLLFLVTFRAELHLGSDLLSRLSPELVSESMGEKMSKESFGNEYFYGVNVMLSSREFERHYWGKRLLTIMFIRPIPKQLWPTKYEDVGMAEYMVNVGLGYGDALLAPAPPGAATGFAADLYVEFAMGGLLAAALAGWFYGRCWRVAKRGGHFAIVNYGCLIAFSVFFIAQTMEAILSRYLVVIVPTAILWRLLVVGRRPQQPQPEKVRSPHRRRRRDRRVPPPATPEKLPTAP
ncbi:MAG: hypothetical protein KIS67_01910 [Verrucomicrobiae bacterium]|nr:hypothetical protein [Verrucomicrobiae bacterium]